ncbi:MAG: EF-P beta-lysylation protein EpmB [Gammaproteobacteria bacterium]|jgi:EF-P beta-lysylation protein EpmB
MKVASGKTPIITRRDTDGQPAWRRELGRAITEPEALLDMLRLDRSLLPAAAAAARCFGLRVPRGFAARMKPGDPDDPLLRQVLPLAAELENVPGFVPDPVADGSAEQGRGVLRKYHGRTLLIASGSCAVHCRYCFRREFPYAGHVAASRGWADALAAVAADSSTREVILSGGDPLTLSDATLSRLTDGLRKIPHVTRLRIHTRLPVVLPERVDAGLCSWLASLPWKVCIVLHFNHAREIDGDVTAAIHRLRDTGVLLLNQSVLLKGVNDDPGVLADLSETLFAAGVLPYYLHLLDPVKGAAHFDVPEHRARHIAAALAARLPGYLVPRLVREIPGASAKSLVGPFPENATPEPLRSRPRM